MEQQDMLGFFPSWRIIKSWKAERSALRIAPTSPKTHSPNHQSFSRGSAHHSCSIPRCLVLGSRRHFATHRNPSEHGKDWSESQHRGVTARRMLLPWGNVHLLPCVEPRPSVLHNRCVAYCWATLCFGERRIIFRSSLSELQNHKGEGNKRQSNCRSPEKGTGKAV